MLRIKELREKSGIKQKDMANELGIGLSTLSQYETGKREPDMQTVIKIAKYFNVSVDYLIRATPESNSADSEKLAEDAEDAELLNKTLNDLLQQQDGVLFFEGEPMDDETKRLLIASLKNTIRMAKAMNARKKDDNN